MSVPYRLYNPTIGKLILTEEDREEHESFHSQIENNMGDANAMLDIAEFILQSLEYCFTEEARPPSQETTTRLDNFFDPTVGPYGVDP